MLNELSRALYGEDDTTAAEVLDWFGAPDLDLERDGRVAVLEGGRIAAYADLTDYGSENGAAPGAVVKVSLAAEDAETGKLLEESGYRVVRHSFRMVVDLDAEPEPPSWTDGLSVRTFVAGEDDEAVYEVQQESFADMFEPERQAYDEWRYRSFTEPFDPSLWFLAEDGLEVAGVCLCRPERHGDADLGWISVLGVRRPWRRRGLGLALLRHAFAELRGRGNHRVGLGVDGSSPTGAVQLYERAGMRVARRFDVYEKALRST